MSSTNVRSFDIVKRREMETGPDRSPAVAKSVPGSPRALSYLILTMAYPVLKQAQVGERFASRLAWGRAGTHALPP